MRTAAGAGAEHDQALRPRPQSRKRPPPAWSTPTETWSGSANLLVRYINQGQADPETRHALTVS